MKNKTILTIMSIFIITTTLSGCVTGPNTITAAGEETNEGTGPDWCRAGTTIPTSGQDQQEPFKIKGITKYNGIEVCHAEYIHDQGSMIQYFNKKGDYMVMIYKDKNGKVIRQINIANPK